MDGLFSTVRSSTRESICSTARHCRVSRNSHRRKPTPGMLQLQACACCKKFGSTPAACQVVCVPVQLSEREVSMSMSTKIALLSSFVV